MYNDQDNATANIRSKNYGLHVYGQTLLGMRYQVVRDSTRYVESSFFYFYASFPKGLEIVLPKFATPGSLR